MGFNLPPIEDIDVEDLLALPEGYRYELREGNLVIITPLTFWHKAMARRLLRDACTTGRLTSLTCAFLE